MRATLAMHHDCPEPLGELALSRVGGGVYGTILVARKLHEQAALILGSRAGLSRGSSADNMSPEGGGYMLPAANPIDPSKVAKPWQLIEACLENLMADDEVGR